MPTKGNGLPRKVKVAIVAAAGLAVLFWLAHRQQQRSLDAVIDLVQSRATTQNPAPISGTDLEKLPAPVARYLDHVLPAGRHIRLARYRQTGTLRTDPMQERWMAFTASHTIAPGANAFVWDARVAAAPMVHVRVRDSLVDGKGAGQVALLSTIPVASAGGNVEMNSGSLHRFLAEAVWYPSALLPSDHLQWKPIDDNRALATLTHGDTSVALEFRFNAANEVTGIYTPGRWGSFDGGYKQVPWAGQFRDYALRDGVLVPGWGEASWYVNGQWRPVWRGTVVQATLE